MAGYIEKKKIAGKTYYYLTETKRVGEKTKKVRKYLGVHTPAGFEKPRRERPKPILSEEETEVLEKIRKNYSKKHRIGKNLWKEERERLVSFIYNTNAIEGSTLTLEETEAALLGRRVKGKGEYAREARNMKKCVDFLFSNREDISEKLVLKLHRMQMDGSMRDAGRYRDVDVRVGGYFAPRHEEVPELMGKFFRWYSEAKGKLNPFELAALVHLKFVRIHPFRDGNGRMSRLLMNLVLLRNGYPLLNIFDAEKMLYYLVLRKVDYSKRSAHFVRYLFSVFVKQYWEYVG
ncbi:MAG: Fic family protein [Candidatus Micrarchaeota archaeon]